MNVLCTMGKTKSRKHTKNQINVPNQGEVFILAPDILQKLGISIGDIATTQQPNQNPETKKDTEKNRKTKDKNKTSVSNSSGSVGNERIPQKESVKPNKSETSDAKGLSLLENAANTSKTLLNTPSLNSLCEIISNVQEASKDVLSMSSSNSVPSSASVPGNVNDSKRSTSIVETAMLMKKSVFLSPSFSNTDFENTLHDEIAQEPSTEVSAELILPEDIGIKQNYLVHNAQEMAILSESLEFSDSIPAQISETLHNNSCLVSSKDKVSDRDEDIPLSKLRVSLQKTKNNAISEIKIPISSDNSNANLKEQTSLNSKGKNNNLNVTVNKNMIGSNLYPVNVESNKDTSKIYNVISIVSQDESLASSHYLENWNVNTESKINRECQTINIDEDVNHFDTEYTLDNYNGNQDMTPGKDIQDGQINISKIKIISEEIIDSFHLKEIKIPRNTTKLRLTPVSIETKISRDTSCNSGDVHGILGKPNLEYNIHADSNGKNSVSKSKTKETKISTDSSCNSEDISSNKDISEKPNVEHNLNTNSNDRNSVFENKFKEAKLSKDALSNSDDGRSKKDISEKPNVKYNLNTDSNSKNSDSENKVKETKISKDVLCNSEDVSRKDHTSEQPNVKHNLNTLSTGKNDISENQVTETNISKYELSNNEDISSNKDIWENPNVEYNLNDINSVAASKDKETNLSKDESSNSEDVCSKLDISGKPNVMHNINTDSNRKNCISENKVKEIADYLSQIVKRRNSEQIIRDEKKIASNSKRNKSISKLSAQGVEKPGGGESNRIKMKHKVTKTYSHSRKINTTKKDKIIDYVKKLNLKLPPANIDCKDVSSGSNKILQEFCVCNDFGKYDIYCKNEAYEHIHFWYHQNIVKKTEIIYNIYNEDGLNKDKLDSANETVDLDEPECSIICWCNTKLNDYEAEHITVKEDNLPDDLIKQDHKKMRRNSLKEMTANTAPSSSDIVICNLKSEKDVETSRRRSNNSSAEKYKLNKPYAKDIHSPSQSNTQSHCLNNDTAEMAKQRVTRNSVTIKEDTNLLHNNNVKDDPISNIGSHLITRRKSIRLSLNESNTITKATEDPSTSTSKNSSGMEVEMLVKRIKNTASAEVVDTKRKNKGTLKISGSDTRNKIKIETQSPSTSATKKYHVIEIEKPTQTIPVRKYEPRKTSRKSTSVEVVEKNKHNLHEQPITSKSIEAINKPKVPEVSSTSSINNKSFNIAEKPVNRTISSTSVEAADNKSGYKNNKLEQKINSTREPRNRSDVTEAPSASDTEKSFVIDKSKPLKATRNSTSAEGLDKSVNKINQFKQSIKPKASKEMIVTKVVEALSIPTINKSPAVDKDKSAKCNRTSTNVEVEDFKTGKPKDTLEQSIDSSASKTIRKTRNVDAMSTSHDKSLSSNKIEPRKRTRNSITVETVNSHNESSKSTELQSCITRRISQRNPSTAEYSDPPAKRVRQRTETVEFVASLPARNVNIPIKQEIKTEPVSEHNREDVNSFDEPSVSGMTELRNNSLVTCGVCSDVVTDESWQQHLKSHNYLTWKATEQPLDLNDREIIKQYLLIISRDQGGLYCSKCGIMRKYPKSYLHHIDSCDGNTTVNLDTSTASAMDTTQESVTETNDSLVRSKRATRQKVDEIVKCGVCKEDVFNSNWIEHIRIKHQYLAKREGEIPLDQNDEEEVREHLYKISRNNGGLICNHCGANRRYVKVYLDHIKACQGVEEKQVMDEVEDDDPLIDTEVICGVCKLEVPKREWYKHIQSEHKYMAWMEGQSPLNTNDQQQVLQHLQKIAKKVGNLYCWYCNESRKIAKIYLQHVTLCEESGFCGKRAEPNPNLTSDQFECGVCHEIGKKPEWKQHAMSNHYNIAWMVGDIPLNLKNFYAVDKYLKEYQIKQGPFVCKICGLTRSSNYGFYAHVLICGKSEDEVEKLMNYCDICNKKYVCIYKNQHMAAHRDAELKKERKEREEEIKKEKEEQEKNQPPLPNGKRRAAAKAEKVLAESITDDEDGQPAIKRRRISDSEDSVKMEDDAYESESLESEIDSNLSDEENDVQYIRHRKAPLPKLQRMPFKVEDASKYLKQSFLDYQKYHLTNECLYNEWRHTELKSVSEASKYIPTVKTSCNVTWEGGEWSTLNRFDSKKNNKLIALFAGGCIQCMSWAPEDPVNDSDFYLAISTHRGPDVPRYDMDKIAVHPGLIQIWCFGDFRSAPVLGLGIAHNFGTIWAMDWCTSGARDVVPLDCTDKTTLRLGLLAVACSSGDVYIISVPYPPDAKNGEMMICEAHPVVELRLNYNTKSKFQATSICWSPQKGHSTVLVGYVDGTTALYDLNTTSPLLKDRSTETNMTIIYPFLEKKTENSPISALSVTPTLDSSRTLGSICSGGATGASVWSGEPPAAWLHTALATRAAVGAAHWPAHRLLAEIAVSGKVINEIDWYGGGRRIGPMSECATCVRCAASVVAAPPNVRLVRAHPAHPEVKKRVIATLQMVPMNLKVPLKKMKDDNVIILQPVTYKDAVGKYGLEFKFISKRRIKASEEIEQRADRFPLSEVTATSFCPSDRFHHRVALATHAGVAFVFSAIN